LEAYVKLEEALEQPPVSRRELPSMRRDSDGRTAAIEFRRDLGLRDDEPIQSVVALLDALGVRTMEIATDLAIDGMAGQFGSAPFVVLNSNRSNDRMKMNAAHELAHIALADCHETTPEAAATTEARAYEFASNLLLTDEVLRRAFDGRSMVRLVGFKRQYGVSLAAMVYRATQAGIIKDGTAKRLWKEFSRRGWKKREPGEAHPDRAIRFEELLDGAIISRKLDWQRASLVTGIRKDELWKRVREAMGSRSPSIPRRGTASDGQGHRLRLVE